MAVFLGLAGSIYAQNVQFRQTSVPAGIVSQTAFPLPGTVVSTVAAPDTATDYKFAYWAINGVHFADASGFAANPAALVINGPVDAVANYVPTTQDSDGDGLPDWWELRFFTDLSQGPSGNPDGDADDNATEFAKGTSPVVASELMQGGISRRRGDVFLVGVGTGGSVGNPDYSYGGVSRRRSAAITMLNNPATYSVLQESSSPPGVISQTRVVAKGSTVSLSTPPNPFFGHRFIGWFIDGARFDKPAQWQPISITINADTSAVARYLPESQDSDSDGIPDWMEWFLFDSLQHDLTADPDGDGFNLAIEQQRGYSHLATDELTLGGASRRRSATVTVDTTGRLLYRLTSDPATILEQTQYLPAGSVITAPNKNGDTFSNYKFSWWDLNGVRQQDPSGVALPTFQFTLSLSSTATAHYVDPTLDTIGDGISDWTKGLYYGSLTFGAASDTDGDGLTFAHELLRGYSPRAADTLDQGGISRRRGWTIPMNIGLLDQPPAVGSGSAINLTQTSARLEATVNPVHVATNAYFQWGLTNTYGQQTAEQYLGAGSLAVPLNTDLGGLAPDTVYHFRIVASSAHGTTIGDDHTFRTAQVNPLVDPPAITSPLSAAGRSGTVFSYQITATNSPTSYGATGLPGGLSVNTATGLIGGTPAVSGTFTVTITAGNSGGSGGATVTLAILPPPPMITSALVTLGTQGAAFTYQITATQSPSSYEATGLPAGLSVNTATGLISGTPTATGTFNVAISAINSGGTGTEVLTLNIPPPPPAITSGLSASGIIGVGFSYQITATHNPSSYGAAGLPAGLSVNPTSGVISGTAIETGTFAVVLSALNPGGMGNSTLTLTITPPPLIDLQISSVTVDPPSGIQTGDHLVIHWTDSNTGTSATAASFNDLVTVRNTTTGTELLSQVVFYDQTAPGNGPIAGGSSRTRQLNMHLPDGSPSVGNLEFSVTVDSTFLIPESASGTAAEANNTTRITRTATLAPYPDLKVTGLTVQPAPGSGIEAGSAITIQWNDANTGIGAASVAFQDRVKVVNATTVQTLADTAVPYDPAQPGHGEIAAGDVRARAFTLTLPNGAAGIGDLQITITADSGNALFEHNAAGTAESNNSGTITVHSTVESKGPVLSSWKYGGAVFDEGITITQSALVSVQASDASGVSRVEFYARPAAGGTDTLIGTDTNGSDGYQMFWNAEQTTADGDYLITLRAYDTFNNATVESRGFHLGLAPPPSPTIISPENGSNSSREDITITGTAPPNAQVAVYRGGQLQLPMVTASANGSYSKPLTILDGANFFQVAARNRAGEGPRVSVNVSLDRSIPLAPDALQISSRAGGAIQLSWIRPNSAIAGYNVYRASAGFETASQATKVNTAPVTTELYNDTPGADGNYFYRVTAVNAAQTEGPGSALVSALSDRALPLATSIEFVAQGKYDSATGRFGTGMVHVTLNLSEPASSTPFLSLTPLNGTPISISLQRSTDVKYAGSFAITGDTPSGLATATASIRDLAGNRGTEIQAGGTITIDASGPRVVGLSIQPSQSIKNNPAAPVAVTFTATLDTPVKAGATPQFSYTLSSTALSATPIANVTAGTDNLTWNAAFALPSTAGQTTEDLELFFTAQDDLDNGGSAILPPHKFQIYQGDLPGLDSPLSLTARPKPAGWIELNWQSVDGAADYQIFRKPAATGAFTPLALSGTTLTFADLPGTDGVYQYAVAALRRENGQESIGEQSNTASARSDRALPPPPQNLQLQLISQGIKATWEPPPGLTETVKYRVYRAAPGPANAELAAQDVPDLLAVDPSPASAKPYYYATAVDEAGNESPRSNLVYQNIQLFPVRTLAIVQIDASAPRVSWSQVSGNIAGYDIYQGADAERTKLNPGGLIAGTEFSDTAYNGGSDRRYTVVTVDNNQVESLGRSLNLPRLSATLADHAIVYRGVMNRLTYTVRNDSASAIDHLRLKVQLDGKDHHSAPFSLAAGAEQIIPVIVGGYGTLPGASALLTTTIQITPNEGEAVSIVRNGQVALGDGHLQVDLMPSEFVQGGSGKVRFKLANTSTEEIEITTAAGQGAQPSPEVRFKLLDSDGNVLATVPFKLGLGAEVVTLPNGRTVLRLPVGYEFISAEALLPVPSVTPSQLFVRLEIDKIYYHQGQPDQVVLEGFQTRRGVTLTQTSYTGEVTAVSPAESNGDQDIVISGHATFRANSAPAPRVPLLVKVAKEGFDRTADVFTGEDGTFTYTFKALPGEAGGYYDVWAVHPDLTDRTVQKTFLVRRLLVTPTEGALRAPRNYTQPVTLTASTGTGVTVTNLKLEYLAADQPGGILPTGITVDTGAAIPLLGPAQSVALTAKITGRTEAAPNGSLVLRVTSNESNAGGWQKVRVNFELGEASPLLRATPGFLTTGVSPGGTLTETLAFENVGLVPVEGLTLSLLSQSGAAAPPWVSLGTSSAPAELAVGQRRDVPIAFQPLGATAEGDYFFILRATSGNHPPRDVSVHVAVSSAAHGNVLFKVLDMYTGTLNAGGQIIQGVANATIELQNEQVVSVQQKLVSDSLGEAAFDNLPAGSYKYRVLADKHVSTTGRLSIRPGATVNQEVALQYNVVTIEWEVVPVTIEDRYQLNLQATFETNVPAAVVVVDPPGVNLPRMCQGDVFNGEFTLTNRGLIRADNVQVPVPASDTLFKVELLSGIPTSLGAGEQARVSYRMTALGNFGGDCAAAAAGGSASNAGENGPAESARVAVINLPKLSETEADGRDAMIFRPSEPMTYASIGNGSPCVSYVAGIGVRYTYVCQNGLEFSARSTYSIYGAYGDCGGAGGTVIWGGGGGGGSTGGGGTSYAPFASGPDCYPKNTPDPPCPDGCADCPQDHKKPVGSSVNSLSRQFEEDITDLEVRVPGPEGTYARVQRWYRGKDWSFEDKLTFRLEGAAIAAISWRNFEFHPIDAGRTLFQSGSIRILKKPTYYRLENNNHSWSEFSLSGRLTSTGTNTLALTKIIYDANGKRTGISDGNDNQVIWYEWTGEQITAARDNTGRRVEYTYNGKLAKTKDVMGQQTDYEYDVEGRLSKITNPALKTLAISYARDTQVSSILDQSGTGSFFDFNYDHVTKEFHSVIRSTTGKVEQKRFFSNGLLREHRINGRVVQTRALDGRAMLTTDANGNVSREDFNEWGNLTKWTLADGAERTYEYDSNQRLTKFTDEGGIVTMYSHDGNGNVSEVIQALGTPLERRMRIVYDALGNPTSVTTLGTATTAPTVVTFGYSARGELRSVTDPNGKVDQVVLTDPLGNILQRRDRNNQLWNYTYDSFGRPTSITNPLNETVRHEFQEGNHTGIVSPTNKRTTFEYDRLRNLTKTVDPLGNEETRTYNGDGQLLSVTDADGKTQTHEYDSFGRVVRKVNGVSGEVRFTYRPDTASDDPVTIVFPSFTRYLEYDKRRRVVKAEDHFADGVTLASTFTYSPAGYLLSTTDTEGRTTTYTRDAFGRALTASKSGVGSVVYEYDANDNVISFVNPNGQSWKRDYDWARRITKETSPGGKVTTFVYDNIGNLALLDAPNGSRRMLTYDGAGRLKEVRFYEPGNLIAPIKTVTLSRDPEGRLSTYTDGVTSGVYTYDDIGRKLSETVNYGAFSLNHGYTYYANGRRKTYRSPDGTVCTYTYDAVDRLVGTTVPGLGQITATKYDVNQVRELTFPGGGTTTYSRDQLRRPTRIKAVDGNSETTLDLTISYSALGNVTSRVDAAGADAFQYDSAGRLTAGTTSTYTYDSNGNRLTDSTTGSAAWIYDADDRLLADGVNTYTYDDSGALTRKVTPAGTWDFTYDAEQQLVRAERGPQIIKYYYDPFGRRLSKEVNTTVTYYHYSAEGVCGEYDSAGNELKRYGYSPTGVFGERPMFIKAALESYIYHCDHLGTPLKLTDVNGNVVWAATYQDFGTAQVTTSLVENNLRFPGQYYDVETDLHYNLNRYYDPSSGRYLTADPARADTNYYIYAGSNPVSVTDPLGLSRQREHQYDRFGNTMTPDWQDRIASFCGGPCCGAHFDCSDKYPNNPRRCDPDPLNQACREHDQALNKSGHAYNDFTADEVMLAHANLAPNWYFHGNPLCPNPLIGSLFGYFAFGGYLGSLFNSK